MHISAWFSARTFFTLISWLLVDQRQHDLESKTGPILPLYSVLDIGSRNYNGDMKSALFDTELPNRFEIKYTGLDFEPGPNVDIVVSPRDQDYPFPDNHFDAIITSSALEHDPRFWITFLKILRVLKPGGFLSISVPFEWEEHRYPVDCWRFYGDSGRALVSWGQDNNYFVDLILALTLPEYQDAPGRDSVMIIYKIDPDEDDWEQIVDQYRVHFSTFLQIYHEQPMNVDTMWKCYRECNVRFKIIP